MKKKLLTEKVKTLLEAPEKEKVVDTVWNMLQKSYSKVPGGFATASSPGELIDKSGLWKVVYRGDRITAVVIYKSRLGRKSIAMASDGTVQGIEDLKMIKREDLRMKRAWAEVARQAWLS